MPSIGIGDTCVFYEGGDTSLKPKPAVVIDVDDNNFDGPITIRLFNVADALKAERRNVRHLEDTEYLTNPDQKREYGAWDFRQVAQERRKTAINEKRKRVQKSEADQARSDQARNDARDWDKKEQDVLTFKRTGKTLAQIVSATLLSHKEVKKILEKYGEKVPTDPPADPPVPNSETVGANS